MIKHTDGPWMIWDDSETDHPKWVVDSDDADGDTTVQVAVCESESAEADALLISCAPDLLEALRAFTDLSIDHTPSSYDEAMLAGRALVAKIEGDD